MVCLGVDLSVLSAFVRYHVVVGGAVDEFFRHAPLNGPPVGSCDEVKISDPVGGSSLEYARISKH